MVTIEEMAESKPKQQKTSAESGAKECKKEKDMHAKVKCHSNGALSKKLGAYFNDSHFHDVVLKLPGGQEYKAHRLVLCVWSRYFKEKLLGPSRSRAPSTLDLGDMTEGEGEAFELVLRFMYTGEVKPRDDNVMDICHLAERFGVRELRRLCEEWISNNIGDHNFIGASARLRDAEMLNLPHVTKKCREIFCHYFTRLPDSTWTSLSVDHVEEILKSPEIVAKDEYHVLEKIEAWAVSNGGIEQQTEALVSRLLPLIRCRFISASQLKQVREGKMGELFKRLPGNVLEGAFEFRAIAGEKSSSIGSREGGGNNQNQLPDDSPAYPKPRLYYNFDFVGPSSTSSRSSSSEPFQTFRISSYSSGLETAPMLVFNNDGHCWESTRGWRYECKPLQDSSTSKEGPWRLRFTLTATNRSAKSYHVAFLIRETKPQGQAASAASPDDRELLVLVAKGKLIREENGGETTKKVTLVTPPIFEKSPRVVELCFIGNAYRK